MNSRSPDLILASQSPRRRQLLQEAGYAFEVIAPHESVERGVSPDVSPEQFVKNSALAKAEAVAAQVEAGIILAADTVAVCQSRVLGKPDDREHAEQMLRLMSGQRHRVLTGICIWIRPGNRHSIHVEETILRMDHLSDHVLHEILESNGWVGKAGAFGFQDGLDWLHIESGLESNVVGLPVERIDQWIEDLMAKTEP
jgi:septum formation protein